MPMGQDRALPWQDRSAAYPVPAASATGSRAFLRRIRVGAAGRRPRNERRDAVFGLVRHRGDLRMSVPRKALAFVALTALALSACTLADEYSGDEPEGRPANYVASDAKSYVHGDVLTTPDGMTVYVY